MIHIRLALHTEFGPVGPRLEREAPMPKPPYDFPDTEEGRKQAEEQKQKMQEYCDRTAGTKGRKN
jgi:hypothetical protein